MSSRARARTALLLPPITWFVFEQGLSALLHEDCTRWPVGAAWGAASIGLCGIAISIARTVRRPSGQRADPWLGQLAMALAGMFALAILFQTLAILTVPACVR